MVAVVVTILIAAIPTFVLVEFLAKRRRLTRWKLGRERVSDDEFLTSLGQFSFRQDAAVRVRTSISHATRIPADLISANDKIHELEVVGNLLHSSILDYFTDVLPVKKPKNESDLLTVRDFVIEFGPQLNQGDQLNLTKSMTKL